VFNKFPLAQLDPLYSSVVPTRTLVKPPKDNPAACVPAPANPYLAVFKSPVGAQLTPSYSSVTLLAPLPNTVLPPKDKPAVCEPAPARSTLLVFKAFAAIHILAT